MFFFILYKSQISYLFCLFEPFWNGLPVTYSLNNLNWYRSHSRSSESCTLKILSLYLFSWWLCLHISLVYKHPATYPGITAILGDREGWYFPISNTFPISHVALGHPDIEKRVKGNIELQNLPEPENLHFSLFCNTEKSPHKSWPSGLCRKDVEIICWIGKSSVSWVVLLGIWNTSENITKFWNHSFSPCLNPRILLVQLPHFRGG